MSNEIVFNGVKYGSVEEMPPEIRQNFEQLMAGVQKLPGAQNLEKIAAGIETLAANLPVDANVVKDFKVNVNTQKYASAADLPPEMRKAYEEARAGKAGPEGMQVSRGPGKFSISFSTTRKSSLRPVAEPGQIGPGESSQKDAVLEERLRWARTWIGVLIAAVIFLVLAFIFLR